VKERIEEKKKEETRKYWKTEVFARGRRVKLGSKAEDCELN